MARDTKKNFVNSILVVCIMTMLQAFVEFCDKRCLYRSRLGGIINVTVSFNSPIVRKLSGKNGSTPLVSAGWQKYCACGTFSSVQPSANTSLKSKRLMFWMKGIWEKRWPWWYSRTTRTAVKVFQGKALPHNRISVASILFWKDSHLFFTEKSCCFSCS